MKIFLSVVIGFFALVGLAAAGLWLLAMSETQESHFATYEELAASDLIAKGWLPEYLPKSISNISERHDIENNYVFATFEYDRNDVSAFSTCKLLFQSSQGMKYVCPPFDRQVMVLILRPDGTATLESHDHEI